MFVKQLPDLPALIAHRGASGSAPENTLSAIELAARQGATWIEVDVNTSSDHIAYLHHDDHLDRCTDGSGYLIEKPSSVLDQLDAGAWFSDEFTDEKLPRLSQLVPVLQQFSLGLNLEIKPTPGWEIPTTDAICEFLSSEWPKELPLLISSFSREAVVRAREHLPTVPLGMLYCAVPSDWQQQLADLDCQSLHCDAAFINEQIMDQAKASKVGVLCFTVNDLNTAKRLRALGVDSLFTDYPQQLGQALL